MASQAPTPVAPAVPTAPTSAQPLLVLPPSNTPAVGVVDQETLLCGFDLQPQALVGLSHIEPPLNNAPDTPRQKWYAAQTTYLMLLLELGARNVVRELMPRDFLAIVEAFNRRFRGTLLDNGQPFQDRAYNAVHTRCAKRNEPLWGAVYGPGGLYARLNL